MHHMAFLLKESFTQHDLHIYCSDCPFIHIHTESKLFLIPVTCFYWKCQDMQEQHNEGFAFQCLTMFACHYVFDHCDYLSVLVQNFLHRPQRNVTSEFHPSMKKRWAAHDSLGAVLGDGTLFMSTLVAALSVLRFKPATFQSLGECSNLNLTPNLNPNLPTGQ